jgi:hypothetical protein
MTTLNQASSNMLRINELAIDQYNLIDNLYLKLNTKQLLQRSSERGNALARVLLRCRVRDPSLSEISLQVHVGEVNKACWE